MWITSICLLLSVGYRGQHDRNTQVANFSVDSFHFNFEISLIEVYIQYIYNIYD